MPACRFLGLCLGAQLLTRAAGGRVGPHPEGLVEIGYVDVEPTEAGREWFRAPMKVYQWHREGMTIPDCCELLATNDRYPVQGFRCGPKCCSRPRLGAQDRPAGL
jgi:GMP synthase (glutamine-hydrolysing)